MKKIRFLKEKLIIIPIFLVMYAFLALIGASCVIRLLFGIPCPFCGMTRAVISLLTLKFSAAVSYHPMVWSLPILLLYFLYDGEPTESRAANVAVLSVTLLGFVLVWILRLVGALPTP